MVSKRCHVPALTALLSAVFVVAACGGAASPSGTTGSSASAAPPSNGPTGTAGSSPSQEATPEPSVLDDAVSQLAGALAENGADVRLTGPFTTDPVGGDGVGLCVDGRQVNVYVFPTAAEAEAVASRIDPDDPSNLGTAMVSWVGNPRFWRSDRLLVLYLGDDPGIEAGLTALLGAPFARSEGPGLPGDPSTC